MSVARPPNQMGPQRACLQALLAVAGQYQLFGQRFGMRIVTQPAFGIGNALVHAALIITIKRNAWAAGENQPAHAMLATSLQDVLRAGDVDPIKLRPRAPDASDSGNVKHNIHTLASSAHLIALAN